MISWIIYTLVTFILFFVLFIGSQGINRGIKAKKLNNLNNDVSKSKNQNPSSKISITHELNKLNKLHSDGALNKKQFEAAKKKILS